MKKPSFNKQEQNDYKECLKRGAYFDHYDKQFFKESHCDAIFFGCVVLIVAFAIFVLWVFFKLNGFDPIAGM